VALVPSLGTDLIPQLAQDRFEMTMKLPPGTRLSRNRCAGARGAEPARRRRGHQGSLRRQRHRHAARCESDRVGREHRQAHRRDERGAARDTEASDRSPARNHAALFPAAQVKFGRPEIFSFSTPLEIELRGQDLGEIEAAGRKLAGLLNGSDRYADVKSTVEQGFPEIQIRSTRSAPPRSA
jgi:HAE1 family hydrophobic/amphiphilic exporter-1